MMWYLNRTGQNEGPFSEAQILHMIAGGHVCPQHLVFDPSSNRWVQVFQVPQFGIAFNRAPAPYYQPHPPPYPAGQAFGPASVAVQRPVDMRFDPRVRALTEEASTWLIVFLVSNALGLLLWGVGLVGGLLGFWKGRRLRAEMVALGARPSGVVTYLWFVGLISVIFQSIYLSLVLSCVSRL